MTERDQATGADEKQKVEAKITALRAENEKLREQLIVLHDAIKAIKTDPKAAADPKYAFLLSAAHMHQTGAVAATGGLGATAEFTGNGAADRWVTGGNNGMTFEQRRLQNVEELEQLREQAANESDPVAHKALELSIDKRTTLIRDMGSARDRGGVKAKVYAAAMRILTAENAVATPEP